MSDDFKLVTTSTGYLHRDPSKGHGSATLHGVECPRCKCQFPLTLRNECPKCGHKPPNARLTAPDTAQRNDDE